MPSVTLSRNILSYFRVMTSENCDVYIFTLQLFLRTSYLGKMEVPHNQIQI